MPAYWNLCLGYQAERSDRCAPRWRNPSTPGPGRVGRELALLGRNYCRIEPQQPPSAADDESAQLIERVHRIFSTWRYSPEASIMATACTDHEVRNRGATA